MIMLLNWFRNNKLVLIALLAGISVRIFFAFLPGQPYDIAIFNTWARSILRLGPQLFYNEIWTDYLPLPLYFLAFIKKISLIINYDFQLTMKMTISLIEVLLILFLTSLLGKKKRVAVWLLISPALIINSSLWGQLDSIVALLLAVGITTLVKNKWHFSAIAYGIALAMKPIVVLTAPFAIIIALRKKHFWKWSFISGGIVLSSAIPAVTNKINNIFSLIEAPIKFLLEKATYQASVYPYTTINAFNFWSITGKNWISDQQTILGISAHTLGLLLFIALAIPIFLKITKKKPTHNNLIIYASLILLLFFTFATRMHERHMLYALPLLAIGSSHNKKFRLFYIILTLLYTVNVWAAYEWIIANQTWPIDNTVRILLSITTVATTLAFYVSSMGWKIKNIRKKINKNKTILIILTVALISRTIMLSNPNSMIFDEVYHAFTARELLDDNVSAWQWWRTPPKGFAYEWTHPPVAKYGMVAGMILFGKNSFGWRIPSALIGVASIYLIYELTKKWTKNKQVATLAAALTTIEGLHLVQSRIAMNDIYMIVFVLTTMLYAEKNKWKHAGILFGFALASKWSAIYGLFPLSYIYFQKNTLSIHSILQALRYILISVIVYILLYTPFFLGGHTYKQFIELQRQMWYYHTNLDATHTFQSKPWQWIISARPVWYFVNYAKKTTSNIYAHANPSILWLGLIAILSGIRKPSKNLNVARIGYLSFLLPWVISPRIMFFYHYLPSIVFLIPILSAWIIEKNPRTRRILILLILATFIILLPMYYAIPMPKNYWKILFTIFPTWK